MLAVLLNEKPWSADWPESIRDGFEPVRLAFPSGSSLAVAARKTQGVILALREETPYARNRVVEQLRTVEAWSNAATHFMYPPTLEGWDREFQQLCVVAATTGGESQTLAVFLSACYPGPALDALSSVSRDRLSVFQNDFLSQLADSLKTALTYKAPNLRSADPVGESPVAAVPEPATQAAPVASAPSPASPASTDGTSPPPATPARPERRFQPPAVYGRLEKWIPSLRDGNWDDARKREWFDSKLKSAFEESQEKNREVWFETELLPALGLMDDARIDILMRHWPDQGIVLSRPADMVQTPRFWGILKNSANRERMMEEVLPRVVRFGSLPVKDKLTVGQKMLSLPSLSGDEVTRRIRLWENLGGELDAIVPAAAGTNVNENLFSGAPVRPETFRNWIVDQNNAAWTEALVTMGPRSSRPRP
jgi:hypothetical protein